MGIKQLMQFLTKNCPQAIVHRSILHYKNKTLAIDSASTIYQFLVKTITSSKYKVNTLTDSHGNQTGHLIGIMYRALLCFQVGIKPIWVFDGRPPTQKLSQLKRRKTIKQSAQTKSQEALSLGDMMQAAKQSQRTIKITKKQIQDTITMLNLMGMPIVRSYSESQAQCSWLTKNNLADGVISQDLDTLAFGATKLIKEFGRNKANVEITYQTVLKQTKLTNQQFIDFCILCGCDYTSKISQIGPVKGYKMIQEYKNIETILQVITNDQKKRKQHQIPDDFNYLRARQLFKNPLINDTVKKQDLQIRDINQDGLREFLKQKQFDQGRVQKWIKLAKNFKQILQTNKVNSII